MKSASLMPRKRKKSVIGGMVASPTPMVPMSGDSITVMPRPGIDRASMLAATQPAVPPPRMAIDRMRLSFI